MILGAYPLGSVPLGYGGPFAFVAPLHPPTLKQMLAQGFCLVPDLSDVYTPVLSLPRIARRSKYPIQAQGPFTIFFNTPYARNWQGGMTFIKPSGAVLLISPLLLLEGVDPTAGALIPSNQFVAYQFQAGDLDEAGFWEVYLTSATGPYGTGQGVVQGGSGVGVFLVIPRH